MAALFGRFTGDLVRFLTRRVRSAADARDLAQETYVRLLRVDRLELVRDPQAYLFRVAANLAYEHQLKQRRERLHLRDVDVQADLATLGTLTPEDDAERALRAARLAEALASLAPRHRAAVILHRRDGLTYEEIAAELGVTAHAVKKYLAVGLSQCRERLAGWRHEP